MDTDVLIVGAGLSGLAIARQLQRLGREFLLVDGRNRPGGRVKSTAPPNGGTASRRYDLGPAWFWPGQDRMAKLVDELGLQVFEQFSDGNLVFQDELGAVSRNLTFATMAGSLRLANGMASLTDALAAQLPTDRIRLQHAVRHVRLNEDSIEVRYRKAEHGAIQARHLVCAVPPRVLSETISFDPALTAAQQQAIQALPTWMAAHAKVIAIYGRPFWREAGLSGGGISRHGPLAEIHDASPPDASEGALFGFVGIPAQLRMRNGYDLRRSAIAQLAAMFGPLAGEPRDVLIADWAVDRFTATASDLAMSNGHPTYGLPTALRDLWGGRLLLSSTETADYFGGFLEGALEAAESTCHRLQSNSP